MTHLEQTEFREYEQQGTGLKPKQRKAGFRQVGEAGGRHRRVGGAQLAWELLGLPKGLHRCVATWEGVAVCGGIHGCGALWEANFWAPL